ncbi:MAG: hypothetical protein COT39_00765 [Parcubacteria group bacterium CG08_land_8_20_14_0_20_48_21]|nr:MAG: hypothetical protein COT39_00765 [Parcubacteria group bacterium CG08_land_8_20_14_0_20_48_21]
MLRKYAKPYYMFLPLSCGLHAVAAYALRAIRYSLTQFFLKSIIAMFRSLIFIKRSAVAVALFFYQHGLRAVLKNFLAYLGVPFYRSLRFCEMLLRRFFVGDEAIGVIIGKRSLLYIIFIMLGGFVIAANLQAQETRVDVESFGKKSLLAELVQPEEMETETVQEMSAYLPDTGVVNYFSNETAITATVPLTSQEAFAEEYLLEKAQLIGTTQDNTAVLKSEMPSMEKTTSGKRTDIVDYTVEIGDTISILAENFGISVNTILWENNLGAYDYIRPGDVLRILPETGIRHTVKAGDSLDKIARQYDGDSAKIIRTNRLADADDLQIGQKLFLPGGRKPFTPVPTPTPQKTTVERIVERLIPKSATNATISGMIWPTSGHVITQYYGWQHGGLDIDGNLTSPIYAAESGTVIASGWNASGYGIQVLIEHGNGIITRYAHLSKLWVEKGEPVAKGQTVGIMGSTGRSTGSHLHFEVMLNGQRINPLNYIR